ncbi:MAG: hypothetical protein WKF77_14395 [Planctomycetaceae bacterium]
MESTQIVLLVVTVSWFVAAIALAVLYRKQLTWLKFLLALIFCGLGAASAYYCFLHWLFGLERESAAHLVGVTHIRLSDDVEFLQSYLGSAMEIADGDQRQGSSAIDWTGTFELKHHDIVSALDDVIQNDCIQRYYSVWGSEVALHKDHLDMLGKKIVALTELRARSTTFVAYVNHLEDTGQFLDRLSIEIRSGTEQNAEPELSTTGF